VPEARVPQASCRAAHAWAVLGVTVLAALLRFYGLGWGLPDSIHGYSYHPDEFLTVGAALYLTQSLIPVFYNYPSLYIYASGLFIVSFLAMGFPLGDAGVYLTARAVTAAMGTGAVLATYWAGRQLFGAGAALVAACIICILPLHVQHSHFATVDVPCTLFVALSLGYAGRILRSGAWRDYIIAGVCAGLAAGTKYNAGLVVFSPLAAHLIRSRAAAGQTSYGRLLGCLVCAVGAFIVSTPGTLLNTTGFVHGVASELRHAANGHGLVFAGTGSGFVYTFTHSLWYGLGPALAILALASVAYVLWRRDAASVTVLAFAVPYYVLISVSQVRFARYSLPLFPAAALLCGVMIAGVWRGRLLERFRAARWIWGCTIAAVVIATTLYTVSLNRLYAQPDPRNEAAQWIFSNISRGSRIGVMGPQWYYSPPLSKMLGFGTLDQRTEAMETTDYALVWLSGSSPRGAWVQDPPEWIIVSDNETEDAQRLRDVGLSSQDLREQVENTLNDLDLIGRHYKEAGRFERKLSVWGISFGETAELPHDMRYPCPAITVYELRK